jgi:hypothetical protein
VSLGGIALAEILTRVFFASLQMEEAEHHPIRVALMGGVKSEAELEASISGWKSLRFRHPCACTTRNLLRLSRAASAERLFIAVAGTPDGGLVAIGLAREGFGPDEGAIIKLRAPRPGNLEVWVSGKRVIEYVQGYVQAPPEDVLLSWGLVRTKLLSFAAESQAPSGYIESIASIIRHLTDHPHGGILVLSADDEPDVPAEATYALQTDTHLWDMLHQLGSSSESRPRGPKDASSELLREVLRAEIERTISEVGHMTALDGATVLDRRLGVRGFGIVLPVHPNVSVVEVMDAAATKRHPFALEQYGARHRAAASYAATHPGSLVFIASVSGDIGCMLREEHASSVMLWRFRSGDLASPAP